MQALPLAIISVDIDQAETAGILKHDFKLPYADAFASALALSKGATLITADFDFKPVAQTMRIEFLPAK